MPTAEFEIPTLDGQADAFAAFPDGGERHPGVLLYMDIFGIRPELERRARELAVHGYYVLVPNVFYRHGPAPLIELPDFVGEEARPRAIAQLMPVLQAHTTDRILRDAEAYVRFLTGRPEVSPAPIAVVGYCMGGRLALRTAAAHRDQVAAVAAFHAGELLSDAPDSLHLDVIPAITADVHLGHAASDMQPEAVRDLNRVLDGTGVAYTSEIYPDTIHGFTMSDTAAFSPAGLEQHWDRLLSLLAGAFPGSDPATAPR